MWCLRWAIGLWLSKILLWVVEKENKYDRVRTIINFGVFALGRTNVQHSIRGPLNTLKDSAVAGWGVQFELIGLYNFICWQIIGVFVHVDAKQSRIFSQTLIGHHSQEQYISDAHFESAPTNEWKLILNLSKSEQLLFLLKAILCGHKSNIFFPLARRLFVRILNMLYRNLPPFSPGISRR